MKPQDNPGFAELKSLISKQKKILEEMNIIYHSPTDSPEEKRAVHFHLAQLILYLKKENSKIPKILAKISPESQQETFQEQESINLEQEKFALQKNTQSIQQNTSSFQQTQPIQLTQTTNSQTSFSEKPVSSLQKKDGSEKANSSLQKKDSFEKTESPIKKLPSKKILQLSSMERDVLKRIGAQPTTVAKKKENAPSSYAQTASKLFSKTSNEILRKKYFDGMVKDLLRTYMEYVPAVYISIILFSTFLAVFAGIFLFLIFLFFKISLVSLSITLVENLGMRFLSTFWIIFAAPVITFLFLYFYPSVERKSLEAKINRELPFATINMSAISGSLVEPTNIFNIIVSTGEYPTLKKEFTKVLNEINIYGYDLVTALKNSASSSPSDKLAELYNGLSTTITTGGNLATFFNKRAETLLLDYRLEREKSTKTAETFIDVYISIVIAAPMILMLLLMMIQLTGMGISLSPSSISLLMVVGVSIINVLFLVFLHLKQPSQ